MKNKLLRFPFTSVAVSFAVIVVSAALIGDINLIEMPVSMLNRIEHYEVADIVTVFVLVIVAVAVDDLRAVRREEAERQAEQLRVVHVTMRTVQDIVNNCLNQIQLLRLDAEGLVPEESLVLFDAAIQETSARLRALGNLKIFAERQMAAGSGVDVSGSSHCNVRPTN